MREARIQHLPVPGEDNHLVGIISKADLVRAFAAMLDTVTV